MSESPEARLAALGLELPAVPAPLAAYVPAVRTGRYVYTAGQLPMLDGKGRSPSEQVKEPVAALSRWLSTNKRGTPITPVVLLTHPRARVGHVQDATVRVERSVRGLLALMERSSYALDAGQRADIERLVRRDHQFHAAKRARS